MSRTRLQGLEIAGVQIGIEVPSSHRWSWPDDARARFACLPRAPDVHVGVRVGRVDAARLPGECYALGPWTFEVARRRKDWVLGLSRDGRREQIAVFDEGFRAGEVVMRESFDGAPAAYPLRGALDEWIVLHRLITRGGLCLHARVDRSDDAMVVRMGRTEAGSGPRRSASASTLLGRDTVWVAERAGVVRVHPTPWGGNAGEWPRGDLRVDAFDATERSLSPHREVVDPVDAAELLVAHSVVPVGDEGLFDRVLENARRLGERVTCRRIGAPVGSERPAEWQGAAWQSGVAPPRGLA